MNGFTEEWLADYQKRQQAFQQRTPVEVSSRSLSRRAWKEAESCRLRQDYNLYSSGGILDALAQEMGRTKSLLARKARALGLTDQNRKKPWLQGGSLKGMAKEFFEAHEKMNDTQLADKFCVNKSTLCKWRKDLGLRKDVRLRWVHTPHPRGATGTVISPSHREKLTAAGRAAWDDPNHVVNSPEARQRRSDRMSLLQASGDMRVGYSRGAMGRRSDIGNMFFRSAWEANYARYLNFLIKQGSIFKWEYQADTFWFEPIKRGVRSYKPDFKIWATVDATPYYIEIKGWMDAKSKTKMRRMKKYHPSIRVDLIDEKQFRSLARSLSGFIPGWEKPKSGSLVVQQSTAAPGKGSTLVKIERLAND